MSRDPKDLTEQMQGFYARFKAKMDAAGQRFILKIALAGGAIYLVIHYSGDIIRGITK